MQNLSRYLSFPNKGLLQSFEIFSIKVKLSEILRTMFVESRYVPYLDFELDLLIFYFPIPAFVGADTFQRPFGFEFENIFPDFSL